MTDPVTTDLRAQIIALLAEVSRGGSADKVADALRSRDIKGRMSDTCECPIAHLIKTLPGIDQVDVVNGHVVIWASGVEEPFSVDLTGPLTTFVFLFDQGVYLDLVQLLPAVSR
ncbi:hypothetical protein Q0Z83_060640 [Actinoplanes sichuanensis]|uniref:Uncharacterized protein n=1 Tax=Actinoplanes sichuanensis TaxID=512349 RepID=A0ABW4A6L1_9ACTN|nr:hypothetical protein [Actinoplanes sichuanensis]BEL07873.1 hypothetical protein Q0Z83_060640 [Actinoplanes sichuanensis]